MLIGFRRRFLFIHVPKCAGESLTELLRREENGGVQLDRKHGTWRDAQRMLGDDLARFRTLAVVRNPFDQVVSFYEHLRKPLVMNAESIERQFPGTGGRITPAWASGLAMELAFTDWVREVYERPRSDHERPRSDHEQPRSDHERPRSDHERPRSDRNPALFHDLCHWLADADGRIAVDRVLRFESLEADFASIAAELGVQGALPHANASPRDRAPHAFRDRYDSAARATVERHFAPTLAAFGYGF